MASSKTAPLKVLIVGAGIGGLTAGLALRQQGHKVVVFEKSALVTETGAAQHLAPNSYCLLRRLGINPEEHGANVVQGATQYRHDGHLNFDIELNDLEKTWGHKWVAIHRVDLHEALKNAATKNNGSGTPIIILTSSCVVDVDASIGIITLDSGERIPGDLVIGADGIGSTTRKYVPGGYIKPFDSGQSAFRFMIPRQKILGNPLASGYIKRDGNQLFWFGNDRRIVAYPCSDNTLINFVCIFPSILYDSRNIKVDDWQQGGSKKSLLEVFKDFEEPARAILDLADPDSIKVWTLLDMEKLDSWINGRLALLGDAAHPFLPFQGQGGAIAIEDAISIGVVFPHGTPSKEVPARLKLYEKIRSERAHKIQHFSRLAGRNLNDAEGKSFDAAEARKYNFNHDEWLNSHRALEQWLSRSSL